MQRRTLRMAVALLVLASAGCEGDEPLPVWAELPEFSLSDQDAETYGTEQLRGQVWVADFVFTSCPSRCPLLTRRMEKVQREIVSRGWPDVRLVSISVDPETDSPAALTEYANHHGANAELWRFLTGPREQIWQLSVDGFKLPVAESQDSGLGPILHSNKFVLTDRQGRIRGYYDALEEEDWNRLIAHVDQVRNEAVN
jgi:protein SCO1/2